MGLLAVVTSAQLSVLLSVLHRPASARSLKALCLCWLCLLHGSAVVHMVCDSSCGLHMQLCLCAVLSCGRVPSQPVCVSVVAQGAQADVPCGVPL